MMERNSINFYRCLTFIFEYLTESNDTSDLNSNVFRPFLVSLTYTSEMQAFHLCLQLFQKFEFIFTHELLHFLLRHLLSACTHPALIPSQRLMFLDFVCDLLPTFKDVEMVDDLQLMEIQPAFDGPDTQEKKLAILTHGPTPDDQLLFCLKPLKQLSLINLNPRASNALYRCLNRMLLLRPSMVSTIEYLLLSMILKSPQQHICRTLSLLRLWPQLSEHVLRLIIQETIDHTDNFHDESELKAYFQAFEWILRKVDFQIDEQDTIGILNFICKKSETSGTLHSYAINCCSAVIRNQFLTQSVKQNLTGCLKLLSSSPHLTLQQSSWVQIFLIGIQSLPNEDNFKRIFNDPLAFETITIKRTRKDVDFPIEVHALNSKDANSISFERYIDKPFQLPLKFELSINCQFKNQHEENPVSELFTIEFGIENEMQQILEEVTINYLNETKPITVEFAVEIKNIVEFDLNINARCSNMLGHLFTNTTMTRQIELIDMMLPCEITSDQFHQVWLQQANRTDSVLNGWIKHVITLRHVQTISDLINRLPWIKRFLISQNLIAIAIPNNIFIFGHLIEIDQTVNWKVITNRSIGLKPLLVQLSTLM